MQLNSSPKLTTFLNSPLLTYSEKQLEQQVFSNFNLPNETARYTSELNQIALEGFIKWVKTQIDLEELPLIIRNQEELVTQWSLVNGTPIRIGKTRLVLIPNEASDTDELAVPQEWVDLPEWSANYYLAMQCNREEEWLKIWGYATHQMLKEKGDYDPIAQIYSLEATAVISDLETLWLAQEFGLDEIQPLSPISNLETATAKELLKQLSQPSPFSPRLELPFQQWAALIKNPQWRQELHQLRLQNPAPVEPPNPVKPLQENCINLMNWLEGNFTPALELGWQNVDELLTPKSTQSLAFRGLRREEKEEQIIEKAKLIDLQIQVDKTLTIVLLVAVKPERENKTGVLLKLHPQPSQKFLPSQLKLTLCSESKLLQEVVSREGDNYIQLPYFRCPQGVELEVKISFGELVATEKIIV